MTRPHLYDTTQLPETYRPWLSYDDETVLGYVQRVTTGLGPMWESFVSMENNRFLFLGFFYTEQEAWNLVGEWLE